FEIEPKDYTDLIRIEEHHNPPEFMLEIWKGELIDLCRDCHILKLHPLITEIINKYSNKLKPTKSMDWAWKYVPSENKEKCRKEIIEFTNRWLNENGDTNSETTS
ncbi:MAG TPA: hypothetical protein VMZ91_15115, partial [Candidatus Paceibacterota bacterium]|nr:hypothetical protein [Candidatus Paceibacterota bacterium]